MVAKLQVGLPERYNDFISHHIDAATKIPDFGELISLLLDWEDRYKFELIKTRPRLKPAMAATAIAIPLESANVCGVKNHKAVVAGATLTQPVLVLHPELTDAVKTDAKKTTTEVTETATKPDTTGTETKTFSRRKVINELGAMVWADLQALQQQREIAQASRARFEDNSGTTILLRLRKG